jgi:hypothetical protein
MTANAQLPELVQRYLDRAVPSNTPAPTQVRITQTGAMRMKPGRAGILPLTALASSSSEFHFGTNSGATPAPPVRPRRRLLIAWLPPASKRSALSLS